MRAGARAWLGTVALAWLATAAAQDADDAMEITVTEVLEERVAPSVPAAGTIFSRYETQITAGLDARLDWVAEPGDFVEAGEAVARFDCRPFELQRAEQQALAARERINVETLGREAARLETLRETLSTSATQLERIQADRDLAANGVEIARVRIAQIDARLDRCTARAPFSGVVTERLRTASEDVERHTVIARLTDTHNLEVRASLPIRHLPRLALGSTADVRLTGLHMEGRVRKIVPAGDPLSQTFQVRIDLPASASSVVAAGQLVSVTLPLVANASLTVPRDSIVLRQEGAFVMRIDASGKAEQVDVELADAEGERVAVRGALSAGDRIAVRGAEALSDGQKVSIRSES